MMWTKHVEQVLLLSDLYETQVITSASLMIIMMICLVEEFAVWENFGICYRVKKFVFFDTSHSDKGGTVYIRGSCWLIQAINRPGSEQDRPSSSTMQKHSIHLESETRSSNFSHL